MSEYEYEEVRGLPNRLPQGESILWQGAPNWRVLARRTFHVRSVAIYFAVLVLIRGVAAAVLDDASILEAIASALLLVPIAATGLALLAGLAWWHARTTVYTITDRRVVLRFGIALQLAVNLPFREIGSAALSELSNGVGEIPLSLSSSGRLAYLHMWPHVRPGRFRDPEPMLRCIANGRDVANLLTRAWSADAERRGVENANSPTSVRNNAHPPTTPSVASAVHTPAGALG